MKLYRNAIILVIVLGLLTGAYYVFKNNKKVGTDTDLGKPSETIKILSLDQLEMAKITVENSGQTMVFERTMVKQKSDDGKETDVKSWKISSPADLRIDPSKVESLAINVSSVIADKLIEENAADLSKYGLDKPVRVTVQMNDGSVKTLEIGSQTPTKAGYYVKEKDAGKVYTIDSYTGEKIKVAKNNVRDDRLFPDLSSDNVTGFAMERKGQSVFTSKKAGNTEWNLTSPIQGDVNTTSVMPMLDAVVLSTVVNYTEDKPADLSKYGLDKPSYAFEVDTGTAKTRLLLGSESKTAGEIYAKFENTNEVFTLSTEVYNFLDKPLKEIVEVFAYLVNISDVNTMTVEIDGKTIKSDIQTDKDDKDKDKFVVNGIDVSALKDENDGQYFRKFYSAVIGVTLSEIETGVKPSGTPEITFTYNLKTAPGTMKVEFIPKDARSYYVLRNGEYTGITVDKQKFDEADGVRQTYDRLVKAMEK